MIFTRAACLLVLGLLASCSTVQFYSQAIQGQSEVFDKARPVAKVHADPATTPKLRQKLDVVAKMLAFADRDLHLPAKGQYERYTDLKRPYVVWVVYAAPEFSVEGKTWWYPFVGSLEYRGFFTAELAAREAEKWRRQGMDVYVGGVTAYSTLGIFRDPLLNTFIGRGDAELAELLFHELTHQRLYISGDTDFNEALATAVGREGARRWLRASGRTSLLATYEKEMRVEKEFIAIILQSREEMRDVYAKSYSHLDAKKAAKTAAFDHLRQRMLDLDRRHGGSLKIERWFETPVNNARLNTLATYFDLVPGFEALLRQHGGDLESFFTAVKAMQSLPKEQRARQLRALAKNTSLE